MRKNSLVKRAAVLTMAGALAVTGFLGFAPRNVYANDGSYNYVTEGISEVDFDGTAVITSEYANIRDGASTTSPVIATAKKGTVLKLEGRVQSFGKDTKWFKVWVDLDEGGQGAGYISNLTFDMVEDKAPAAKKEATAKKETTAEATEKEATATTRETCVFTVDKVNKTMKVAQDVFVRKGPKTTYDIMGSLAAGKTVQVTGQVMKHGSKACWVQVNFNGKTGYVCTDYLK